MTSIKPFGILVEGWGEGRCRIATLCLTGIGFGIGIGSRLGHPSVTQGWPKGHARMTQGSINGLAFVFNKSLKRAGWGVEDRRNRAASPTSREIGKAGTAATETQRHGEGSRNRHKTKMR
jgi:hypothetical protein